MEAFGKVVAGILVAVLIFLVKGFTLSVLWNWFLPSLGIPVIGIAQAIGVSLVTSYLLYKVKKGDTEKKLSDIVGKVFGMSVIILIIGYIVKLFM